MPCAGNWDAMDQILAACASDIDELVAAFAAIDGSELVQMKELWTARSFSFIHEARPKDVLPSFFSQCLYSSALSHLSRDESIFSKMGALYVLYILYETQSFEPRIKIYLSLEDLQALHLLVKQLKFRYFDMALKVVHRIFVNKMFLYGSVAVNRREIAAAAQRLAVDVASRLHHARERLLANAPLQQHLVGNMGNDPLVQKVVQRTRDYAETKHQIFNGSGLVLDGDGTMENRKCLGSDFGEILIEEVQIWVLLREEVYQQQRLGENEGMHRLLVDNQNKSPLSNGSSPNGMFGEGEVREGGSTGIDDEDGEFYDFEEERALAQELDEFLDE